MASFGPNGIDDLDPAHIGDLGAVMALALRRVLRSGTASFAMIADAKNEAARGRSRATVLQLWVPSC